MRSITFKEVTYTEEKLNQMSSGEMVEVFNELAPQVGLQPVKRFSDKAAATRRLASALNEFSRKNPITVKSKPTNDGGEKEKTERNFRKKRFVFPVKDKIGIVSKPDSLRQRLIDRLKDGGATFEQMEDVTRQFDADRKVEPFNIERRTYEGMRLLHFYVGYGMRHDAPSEEFPTGRITLVEPPKK